MSNLEPAEILHLVGVESADFAFSYSSKCAKALRSQVFLVLLSKSSSAVSRCHVDSALCIDS